MNISFLGHKAKHWLHVEISSINQDKKKGDKSDLQDYKVCLRSKTSVEKKKNICHIFLDRYRFWNSVTIEYFLLLNSKLLLWFYCLKRVNTTNAEQRVETHICPIYSACRRPPPAVCIINSLSSTHACTPKTRKYSSLHFCTSTHTHTL